MSNYPPLPAPTPLAVHVLSNLPALAPDTGDRVGTSLDATLPALRVALVGYVGDPTTGWEAAPMFQVEVWAYTEGEAERIAWNLINAWPTATAEQVGSAVIHGRWITQLPISLPASDDDAENTGLARYMVTVALRLTGVPNG